MAGYSGTPLPRKLGFKEGLRVALIGAPAGFSKTLGKLPERVAFATALEGDPFDLILLFRVELKLLKAALGGTARHLRPNGALWVAWPNRASGVPTDVTEDRVREVALAAGLVDVKVCAIDDVWSGLKCVYRLKDRPKG